jgi:hypothetical protein
MIQGKCDASIGSADQVETKRPQLPSLAEWILRDWVVWFGGVLLAIAAWIAVVVIRVLIQTQVSSVGGQLLLSLVLGVPGTLMLFWRVGRRVKEHRLTQSGLPVVGRVTKIEGTGTRINDVEWLRAHYSYSVDGTLYQSKTHSFPPNSNSLSNGGTTTIWVDADDPKTSIWFDEQQVARSIFQDDRWLRKLGRHEHKAFFLLAVLIVLVVTRMWPALGRESFELFVSTGLGMPLTLGGWFATTPLAWTGAHRKRWGRPLFWILFFIAWLASGFEPGFAAAMIFTAGMVSVFRQRR